MPFEILNNYLGNHLTKIIFYSQIEFLSPKCVCLQRVSNKISKYLQLFLACACYVKNQEEIYDLSFIS